MSRSASHLYSAGQSPIERLPTEVLQKILLSVTENPDVNTNASYSMQRTLPVDLEYERLQPPTTLFSCIRTSNTMRAVALGVMYRHVQPSRRWDSFLSQIKKSRALALSVRILDLSWLLVSTGESVPRPLLVTLCATARIRELIIKGSLDLHLDYDVLKIIFCELPLIEKIDLSECSSQSFIEGSSSLVNHNLKISKSITTLKVFWCSKISPQFFDWALPQLPNLQFLDVSHTKVNYGALLTIPDTARLTYLNISQNMSFPDAGNELVDFIVRHPSTRELVYLNIEGFQEGTALYILQDDEVAEVLAGLPPTLRVLNVKNTLMMSSYTSCLTKKLMKQLRQLSLGYYLKLRDIESLFLDKAVEEEDEDEEGGEEDEEEDRDVLNRMQDAVAVCKLKKRFDSVPESFPVSQRPQLEYLDISGMSFAQQAKICTSILLGPHSWPLEVIEVSERVHWEYRVFPRVCEAAGWEVIFVGRRCRLIRVYRIKN